MWAPPPLAYRSQPQFSGRNSACVIGKTATVSRSFADIIPHWESLRKCKQWDADTRGLYGCFVNILPWYIVLGVKIYQIEKKIIFFKGISIRMKIWAILITLCINLKWLIFIYTYFLIIITLFFTSLVTWYRVIYSVLKWNYK